MNFFLCKLRQITTFFPIYFYMLKIPNTESYLFLIRNIATIIIIIRINPPAAPPAAAAMFTGDCPSNRAGVTVSSSGLMSAAVSSRGVLSAVLEEVTVVVVIFVVVGSVIRSTL